MKKIKRYLKILFGSFLIAITLNCFFKNLNLIPSGVFGFAILYNDKTGMNLEIVLLLANVFFLILGYITLPKRELSKMLATFFLIPLLTYLTNPIANLIDIGSVDKLLLALYGGVLMGSGYRFIYKGNRYVSGSDVIMQIAKRIKIEYRYTVIYIIDALWIIIAIKAYGFETALYSVISIAVMETLSRRAYIGVSASKVFYIVTKHEKEVRDYIIEELNYDLTVFDVKGGFLKTKNKVLMSVIPSKDYYRLREGIKLIDPKAFISITDSYEVVNPNKRLPHEVKLK